MHTHITRAHLKGYRNIRDTEVSFREGLNIIIGPNGCGKSNFLWLLRNILYDKDSDNNIKGLLEFNNTNDGVIFSNFKLSIEHTIDIHNKNGARMKKNISTPIELNKEDKKDVFDMVENDTLFDLLSFNIPNNIDFFDTQTTLYIDTKYNYIKGSTNNIIIKNNYYIDNAFLNFKKPQEIYNALCFSPRIIKSLKDYTPIKDIRIRIPENANAIKLETSQFSISNLYYEFKIDDNWFEWKHLSDGTKRIVWIVLSILLSYNKEIIFIEEPELGIHPHQLALLMEFIKDESEKKQIIITTHCPEVLDILEIEETDRICIARYDTVRKTTVIGKIPAERQILLQKYQQKTGLLSGFWSRIGGLENLDEV